MKSAVAQVQPESSTFLAPEMIHLESIKIYWNSIEFVSKFLSICFPAASSDDAPEGTLSSKVRIHKSFGFVSRDYFALLYQKSYID